MAQDIDVIDTELRDLERRITAGDASARARLLAARVRAGLLAVEQLRLAAYCGDADAQRAVGTDATPRISRSKEWFLGLAPFGKPVCVRAAVHAVRLIVPGWRRRGASGPVNAVAAAEAWLTCPCESHRARAEAAARGVNSVRHARAAVNVARAAALPDGDTPMERRRAARLAARQAAAAAYNAMIPLRGRGVAPRRDPQIVAAFVECHERRIGSLTDVRRVVEAELREWALAGAGTEPSRVR